MRDVINYDLKVDDGDNYQMKVNEAVNVIIKEGTQGIYYDTKENWDSHLDLIAERGGIYVYSNKAVIHDGEFTRFVPGIKVGDGTSYLIDMPFVGDDEIVELAQHINDPDVHTTPEEKEFWNNKVTAFIHQQDSETLVLSRN